MYRLSSSVRTRTAEESLLLAKQVAKDMGVTRVTDITWLDKIGIPVYAGIRPYAATGSLNVHAGKGLRANEAKIGAFMESIEFSLAEGKKHNQHIKKHSLREVQSSLPKGLSFSSFGIKLGTRLTFEDEIYCVQATDFISKEDVLVPAELIFHPVILENKRSLFGGTTTNGLCSGNSKLEAIIHGVCEVLERDVKSFDILHDSSELVIRNTEPESIQSLRKKIEDAGLILSLRKTKNEFRLPYYSAFVLEPGDKDPISVADGYGLHPIAEIAAIRAVTEAVQSRLTHIHGGRDDIVKRMNFYRDNPDANEEVIMSNIRNQILSDHMICDFYDAGEKIPDITSVDMLWEIIKDRMAAAGMHNCFVYELNPQGFPFSIIRVVVPFAEFIESEMKKVGPRFAKKFEKYKTI